MHWDHYRTFEAVSRLGSLTLAARSLGVSQSTVSRHLARLEEEAGSPLLLRETPVHLTQRGEALLESILPMVDAAVSARAVLEQAPGVSGTVTLTTVGELLRWVLVKSLPAFCQVYPHLRLRILAGNQITSLAAGEADLAVRVARPERGELVARKLHEESYGYFASGSLATGPEMPWLGLTGSLARIPEQEHAEKAFHTRPARLLVEDVESLGRLAEAGLGVAILPKLYALRLQGLEELTPEAIGAAHTGPLPKRSFWLVVHRSKQHLPKVRAVMEWIVEEFLTQELY